MVKVLAKQVRGPEFRSPEPIRIVVDVHPACNLGLLEFRGRMGRGRIPRAS